jgi:Flp pilus assembly protein TadD
VSAGCRLAIVFAASVIAGACASANRATLAGRFVRQGTPSVDVGGPRPVSLRTADRNALLRAARTPRPVTSSMASLESNDPQLRSALAQLLGAPTPQHHLDVADAYMRNGVFDRAYDYLNRSLTVNGPEPMVLDALARLWRDWGQPGEGLGHAHRALYLVPKSPIAHNTLGTLLYRVGRRDEARASFSRALELDPSAWYAMANLCYVNMAAGDTKTAIAQCRQATVLRKHADPRK